MMKTIEAYFLKTDYDEVVIGKAYPQVQQMTKGYDYNKPNSIYKMFTTPPEQWGNTEPDLDGFVLHNNAKITDILSNAVTAGILVSEKAASIMKAHRCHNIVFLPCKLYRKDVLIGEYFYPRSKPLDPGPLDYVLSQFYLGRGAERQAIELNSYQEYKSYAASYKSEHNKLPSVSADPAVLLPEYADVDMFAEVFIGPGFIISGRLKRAIGEAGITGIRYETCEKLMV